MMIRFSRAVPSLTPTVRKFGYAWPLAGIGSAMFVTRLEIASGDAFHHFSFEGLVIRSGGFFTLAIVTISSTRRLEKFISSANCLSAPPTSLLPIRVYWRRNGSSEVFSKVRSLCRGCPTWIAGGLLWNGLRDMFIIVMSNLLVLSR